MIYDRQYYLDHRAEILECKKQYYLDHIEEITESRQQYYLDNRADWSNWFRDNCFPFPNRTISHYHHINPDSKLFNVGYFLSSHSCNKVNQVLMLAEIKKCWVMTGSNHTTHHNKIKEGKENEDGTTIH